jgi:hypothetical protein
VNWKNFKPEVAMINEIDTTHCYVLVETQGTFWYLRDDEFTRVPKEGPRPPLETVEGPQIDGTWKKFDKAQIEWTWTEWGMSETTGYIRVIPSGRPEGSQGIVSGDIVGITALPKGTIQ